MGLSRRCFVRVTLSAAAVWPVVACDGSPPDQKVPNAALNGAGEDKKPEKPKLAEEPFFIGPPTRYREPGVYDAYQETTGVWLVSDGKELVALSGLCTHLGCMTEWDAEDRLFTCPCHFSEFDTQGMNREGSKAKRPLERCALRLVSDDEGGQLQVDPRRRFRQEKDQWTEPGAAYPLA